MLSEKLEIATLEVGEPVMVMLETDGLVELGTVVFDSVEVPGVVLVTVELVTAAPSIIVAKMANVRTVIIA